MFHNAVSEHWTEDILSRVTEKYKLCTYGAAIVCPMVVLHVAFVNGDGENGNIIVHSCSTRARY